jgi:hypothetical protein
LEVDVFMGRGVTEDDGNSDTNAYRNVKKLKVKLSL